METMSKVIYEEDFDLCIVRLTLCVGLVKAVGPMKRWEQCEVKSPFFAPHSTAPYSNDLRPLPSLGYHGTGTPLATRPELHKSDFYCVAVLLISIVWRLYLILSLWRAFSGQFVLKIMPVCVCVPWEQRIKRLCCSRILWTVCMNLSWSRNFSSVLLWDCRDNQQCFDESLTFSCSVITFHSVLFLLCLKCNLF